MSYRFEKLSVLVVEDTLPMQKLVCAVLETLGVVRIHTANNGQQGFEKFCSERPDIVIADWHMQPVSGIELLKLIRAHPKSTNRMAPVIMLTGYSAASRIAEARDMGTTEFLVKPFSANDLAKRIAHVISKPRDFVDAPAYFGPDRRRRKGDDYKGPSRRSTDKSDLDNKQGME
jgi:two-component system chemotaxis response regulator CheY